MSLQDAIASLVLLPESETLEFKAVLPPSRSMAQILCAFANSDGGHLILGVNESAGKGSVTGLSKDFHADTVTRRAVSLLSPAPSISHQYVECSGKTLYVIRVDKAATQVTMEGKAYRRQGDRVVEIDPERRVFAKGNYARLESYSEQLEASKQKATDSKVQFVSHIQSVLKIIDDLGVMLYPVDPKVPTTNQEGKILVRILFSSCADNFEAYLSDLLFEIYLSNPSTLRSSEQITIAEVLNCSDIQEFVSVWARKKLAKLQRGSVKGFIADNKQVSGLNVFTEAQQDAVEAILQIRHLYSHKNGIVDEKFLKYFPGQYVLNEEHAMSIDTMIDKVEYLSDTVQRVDSAAIAKFRLVTLS